MDKQAEAALKRVIGMLEAILVREIGLHRELIVLAGDKRESILKGDLEKMEKTVTAEKRLVTMIGDEERKRRAVMPLLKSGLGLDNSVERLEEIIRVFPEPERGKMGAVRAELLEAVEAVQMKSRHNAELLKASLAHVEAFFRGIVESAGADSTYGRNGGRIGNGPAIIDRSA
ncbi:MAG: flagellar protein FlgN [Planctomycetota bacterium]|jgi:flagellar biosynthesis/type III secretory pathway chaperone|nr:flagellar protein FlgN [Planctomycetota bacterium]